MHHQREEPPLNSVPNSLREQLESLQKLMHDSDDGAIGRHSLETVRTREGMKVLDTIAQRCPEVAGLLTGAQMGVPGFDVEILERTDRYNLVERKLFGMSFGHDVVNTPTISIRRIRARITWPRS